jgi:hypothetical protein
MARRVVYRLEFDADCAKLGGIAAVQQVIAPLVQSLEDGNPSIFSLFDVAAGKQYAPFRAIGSMPPLVVIFTLDDDGDAIMERVVERSPRRITR